jgi:hypothetical protein
MFGTNRAGDVSAERIIDHTEPTVGLVIGSFAAVPYIHMQLESRKRSYPTVPVLVSDDGSSRAAELEQLCAGYGAAFVRNDVRKRQMVGDVSSFQSGFQWAAELKVELLVKISRRFFPLYDWVPGLQRLAYETQYATYSNLCRHENLGFRTECVAFHVRTWIETGAVEGIRACVARNEPLGVESFIHNLARKVHQDRCRANSRYEHAHPRTPESDAYGFWDIMADRRTTKQARILWHHCDSVVDYCRVAALYGLGYSIEDLNDPNQGEGLGIP